MMLLNRIRNRILAATPTAIPNVKQCGHSRFLEAVGQSIPNDEIRFFLQVKSTGMAEGVSFVELFNGDKLLGTSDSKAIYYRDTFARYAAAFAEIGISPDAYSAVFDAMISYYYENAGTPYMRKSSLIRRGDVVLDIGVRTGHFAVKASRLVGPTGVVVGIDAMSHAERFFNLHCRINDITNASFFQGVVGDEDGKVVDFYHGSENEAFSGIFSETVDLKGQAVFRPSVHAGSFQTRIISVDTIVQQLELRRCDLIVLELNGAEVLAVKGMQHTLTHFRPTLYMAAFQRSSQGEAPVDAIMNTLREYNYKVLHHHGTELVLVPNDN